MRQLASHDYAISNGHPPVADGVVCIDFDKTIFPWGKTLHDYDSSPFEGAAEAIRAFKEAGLTIVILTSRASATWWMDEGFSDEECLAQISFVENKLMQYSIPWDRITAEKVPAIAYIDDKAIEFKPNENNWEEIRKRVLND